MAKRFCDTELWKNQRWFRKLTPFYKLAFCYIKDVCNHAGLWRIDCSDLKDDLGVEYFDIEDFVETVNVEYDKVTGKKIKKERLRVLKNNHLWITGFIQFQYEGKDGFINQAAAPVRTALLFLQRFDLLEETISKGYITLKEPLQEGWQTPKDKDKEKNKRVVSEKNRQKGEAFDSGLEWVVFKDGSKQKLGDQQKEMAENGRLRPTGIIQGSIY